MTEISYVRALELAELQDAEVRRWRVVRNTDVADFGWEVCRDDDGGKPVMVAGCRSQEVAWNEHAEQSMAAGIRAVLSASAS